MKLLFFIIASIITFFFFFVRYLQAFAIGKWDRDGKKERGLKRGEKYDLKKKKNREGCTEHSFLIIFHFLHKRITEGSAPTNEGRTMGETHRMMR